MPQAKWFCGAPSTTSYCYLAVYATVFGYFHGMMPRAGVATVLPVLVVARALVLGAVAWVAVRGGDAPTRRSATSPSRSGRGSAGPWTVTVG